LHSNVARAITTLSAQLLVPPQTANDPGNKKSSSEPIELF
jgi:hypothetical protein